MEVSSVNNNYDFGSVTSTTNTSRSIKAGTTGASQASSLTTSWTPGNTQPQTFKNLIKAISGYDYRGATGSDYQVAHLTRLWFEGVKKSNGNIVKKTLSMPLKGLVDDIVNGFSSVFGLGSNA